MLEKSVDGIGEIDLLLGAERRAEHPFRPTWMAGPDGQGVAKCIDAAANGIGRRVEIHGHVVAVDRRRETSSQSRHERARLGPGPSRLEECFAVDHVQQRLAEGSPCGLIGVDMGRDGLGESTHRQVGLPLPDELIEPWRERHNDLVEHRRRQVGYCQRSWILRRGTLGARTNESPERHGQKNAIRLLRSAASAGERLDRLVQVCSRGTRQHDRVQAKPRVVVAQPFDRGGPAIGDSRYLIDEPEAGARRRRQQGSGVHDSPEISCDEPVRGHMHNPARILARGDEPLNRLLQLDRLPNPPGSSKKVEAARRQIRENSGRILERGLARLDQIQIS